MLWSINYFHRSIHIWLPSCYSDLYSLYNITAVLIFIIKCSHLVSFILRSYNFHCFEEAQVYNCIFCHQPLPIKNCLNNAEIVPSTSAFLIISIHGNLFDPFLKSDYFSHIGCQIPWAFCCLPAPFAMGQDFIQASKSHPMKDWCCLLGYWHPVS